MALVYCQGLKCREEKHGVPWGQRRDVPCSRQEPPGFGQAMEPLKAPAQAPQLGQSRGQGLLHRDGTRGCGTVLPMVALLPPPHGGRLRTLPSGSGLAALIEQQLPRQW